MCMRLATAQKRAAAERGMLHGNLCWWLPEKGGGGLVVGGQRRHVCEEGGA